MYTHLSLLQAVHDVPLEDIELRRVLAQDLLDLREGPLSLSLSLSLSMYTYIHAYTYTYIYIYIYVCIHICILLIIILSISNLIINHIIIITIITGRNPLSSRGLMCWVSSGHGPASPPAT